MIKVFKNYFFPYCFKEWLKLGDEIQIFDFIRLKENSVYTIYDMSGFKLLTSLRLNFNYLTEHKLRQNFKDTINPMCTCGFEDEATDHYLSLCKLCADLRLYLLHDIYLYTL